MAEVWALSVPAAPMMPIPIPERERWAFRRRGRAAHAVGTHWGGGADHSRRGPVTQWNILAEAFRIGSLGNRVTMFRRKAPPGFSRTRSCRRATRALLVGRTPLALAMACMACGESPPGAASEESATDLPAAQVGADALGTGAAPSAADEIVLTVSSGRFAGTHRLQGDMNCFAQPGDWGAGIEVEGTDGLSGVNIGLFDLPVGGGRTDSGALQLTFGDTSDEENLNVAVYMMAAADQGGAGFTGTAERQGAGGVIRIEAKSVEDGADFTAVVRCRSLKVVS
jgi:hypothetical protein